MAVINPIPPLLPLNQSQSITASQTGQPDQTQAAAGGFSQFLSNALDQLDGMQQAANTASLQLASGQTQDISSAIIAMDKANLAFSLAVQVRDKVLDAYKQVMNMQM